MIQLVIYWRDRALDAEAKLAEFVASPPILPSPKRERDNVPSWLRRKLGVD